MVSQLRPAREISMPSGVGLICRAGHLFAISWAIQKLFHDAFISLSSQNAVI